MIGPLLSGPGLSWASVDAGLISRQPSSELRNKAVHLAQSCSKLLPFSSFKGVSLSPCRMRNGVKEEEFRECEEWGPGEAIMRRVQSWGNYT